MMARSSTDIDAGLSCDEGEACSLFDLPLKTDLVPDQCSGQVVQEQRVNSDDGDAQRQPHQQVALAPSDRDGGQERDHRTARCEDSVARSCER